MLIARLTDEGQVTTPDEVRKHLGLKAGDHVRFTIGEDGRVTVETGRVSIMDLGGMLPKPARPVTLEEMDGAIVQGVVERYRRSFEE